MSSESVWIIGAVVLAVLLFPFVAYLTAKLWAYGSAMGRHRFEQDKDRRKYRGT
jgi:hypothetical protein